MGSLLFRLADAFSTFVIFTATYVFHRWVRLRIHLLAGIDNA